MPTAASDRPAYTAALSRSTCWPGADWSDQHASTGWGGRPPRYCYSPWLPAALRRPPPRQSVPAMMRSWPRLLLLGLGLLVPSAARAQVPPEKALSTFTVADGLEMSLWASEPLFVN